MDERMQREAMRAGIQFMGIAGAGEANPVADVVGVSAGTFKCGSCDADHPGLLIEIANEAEGRRMTLLLTDDAAKTFAASCSRVLAEGAS